MRLPHVRALALLLAGCAVPVAAQQAPSRLRTEYLENPIGIDAARPRFSWALEHTGRGQKQTAFQVLVSLAPEVKAGEVWDSGPVESNGSVLAPYGGKPLAGGQRYYWKVRYWDSAKRPSPYSEVAWFETGLLAKEGWKGQWITGPGQLR